MQLTDVMQFVEATLDRISPARAQELAKQMASGEGREQVAKAAQDLVDWSQKNRERVRGLVKREVAAQLTAMGIPTKDDYEALERRVAGLERTTRKRTTAKRTAAKRTTAKRTAKGAASGGSPAATRPAEEKTPMPGEPPAGRRTAATEPPSTRGGSESTRGN
jgi:polyhydroxyalkanoate synthesis regulator phasin